MSGLARGTGATGLNLIQVFRIQVREAQAVRRLRPRGTGHAILERLPDPTRVVPALFREAHLRRFDIELPESRGCLYVPGGGREAPSQGHGNLSALTTTIGLEIGVVLDTAIIAYGEANTEPEERQSRVFGRS